MRDPDGNLIHFSSRIAEGQSLNSESGFLTKGSFLRGSLSHCVRTKASALSPRGRHDLEARLGRLDEARSAVKTGLVRNRHYSLSAARAYYEKSYKPGYLPAGFPQRLEILRELGVPDGDAKPN